MKILIAMRNEAYSEYLSYCLMKNGHKVHIVNEGMSALNTMKSEYWDLLLIGILLEYYNGLEVIAEYKKYCNALPEEEKRMYTDTRIMIITRVRSEQAQRSARALGVTDYFTLPLETSRLMRKIILSCLLFLYLCLPLKAQDLRKGLQGIGCNYFIEHVSDPAKLNWQLLSAEATIGIAPADSGISTVLLPRLNFAQRTGNGLSFFEHTALQAQLEAYIRFSSKINLTTGYGYSGSDKFPSHQATAELLYTLKKGWGISGGLQVTKWDKTAMAYLVGVEKYVGPFWLTVKPMVVVEGGEAFMAVKGGLRYYYTVLTENYLHVGLFYGNSPEYANYLPDLRELLSLGSWGGYLVWQQKISSHFQLRLGFSYRSEEFRAGDWRNVIGGNTGLTYKF